MKYAFWGVFVFGLLLCSSLGIGPVLQRADGNWLSPFMLVGMVLGVALLALAVAFAAGFRPALLPTDTAMLGALVVTIAAKVGVAALQVGLARG